MLRGSTNGEKKSSVSDLETHFVGVQRRRKYAQNIWRNAGLVIFGGSLAVSLVWLASQSEALAVRSVAIRGLNDIPATDIWDIVRSKILGRNFISKTLGLNYLPIWPARLDSQDLALYPAIASITVLKNWLTGSIILNVQEREKTGIWCQKESAVDVAAGFAGGSVRPRPIISQCWWFDRDGIIFQPALRSSGSVLRVVNDASDRKRGLRSRVLPEAQLKNLDAIFTILAAIDLPTREVNLAADGREVFVAGPAGPELRFSLDFPPDDYLETIQSFQKEGKFTGLQYLDFRIEHKVYYK